MQIAILTVIGIIVIILIILIILLMQIKENTTETGEEGKAETEILDGTKVELVQEREEFYTVKYILNKIFTNINYIEANVSTLGIIDDTDSKNIINEYTQMGVSTIRNLLDESYMNEKNVTNQEIKQEFIQYKNSEFRIKEMYGFSQTIRKKIYFVVILLDNQREIEFIVKTDYISNAFSILPPSYIEEKKYTQVDISKMEIYDIALNKDNEFQIKNPSDKNMAHNYLNDYKNLLLYDIETAYQLLNQEYKNIRFKEIESFIDYVERNKKFIEQIQIKAYSIERKENFTEYICKDQYDNIYIFKERTPMQYEVQLDDYTLENEAFNIRYETASHKDKGILNIDKFFKMINMTDYKAAYALLDETFKLNNFKAEAEFERYMQSNIFRYNKVSYQTYSDKITDLLTFKLKLTDATGEDKKEVQFNVVMKLGEGTDFTMSFEIVKE